MTGEARVSLLLADTGDDETLTRTLSTLHLSPADTWDVVVASHRPSPESPVWEFLGTGERLRWVVGDAAASRAALLDLALRAATGSHVAVLDPADEAEPGILAALAAYLRDRPGTDVLYTDEQWPGAGTSGVVAKPDWVPRYLEGFDYLGRLCAVRRTLALDTGGIRSAFAGAEEWDLHLRVTERAREVAHLPVAGLTRPAAPDTGAQATAAGVRAVADRFARLGVAARVEEAGPGRARVWREVAEPPLVSLVVPTGGGTRTVRGVESLLVEGCLRSLVGRTRYPRWEVVLVPSEGTPDSVVETARTILGDRLRVAPVSGPFSFSRSVNEGVRVAAGDLVVLLNDDTEVIEPLWLDRMVAVAQDEQVGVVGAKLLYEDGSIQHVGIVHDDRWLPVHAYLGAPDDDADLGAKQLDRDYLVVTGACLLTPRDLYVRLGGFSDHLPMAFNDVDYCHKVAAAGRAVVCTPFARLHHFESSTRVPDVRPFEFDYLVEHTVALAQHDPYVNHRSVL